MRLLWQLLSLLSVPTALFTDPPSEIVMVDPATDPYAPASGQPTLADLLTVRSTASIFYDYARDIEALNFRLSDPSPATRITLLAPVNKAVIALARKPHEGPVEDHIEITDDKARMNVERWVSVHMIPFAPISLSSPEAYPTLLDGHNVTFQRISEEGEEWQQFAVKPDIRIVGRAEASNGDLYLIDGVLSV